MNAWDLVVTLIKVFLIAGLSFLYGSHIAGVLFYVVLVALPLIMMRWSVGFAGYGVGYLCLALVGMDLLCGEKAEV